jgi:hypothetical protein
LYNGVPFNEISVLGSYTPLAYNPKLFYKYNFAINNHIYLRDFPHESSQKMYLRYGIHGISAVWSDFVRIVMSEFVKDV